MPVSCSIYRVDGSIDIDSLLQTLQNGYEHTSDHPEFEDQLLTDVTEVEETHRGVSCTIRYDKPKQRGARESESPWYIDVQNAPVRFTEEYFILLGDHSGRAQTNAAQILDLGPDEYERVNITSGTVAGTVAEDSVDEMRGTWQDVDEYTSSATVSGDVDQSSIAHDIEQAGGDATYRQYSSDAYDDRTVGISKKKDRATFWGDAWELEDMEDYIFEFILPRT